jgi:uncharacterized protein (TIGR03032 family)
LALAPALGHSSFEDEMICKESPAHTQPLRSAHSTSFPDLLQHLGISLMVTTYQAGKLVVLRADDGVLNTHFRAFNKPMGLALDGDRLAIGAGIEIWEYHNVPSLALRLKPHGKHDACFLPRSGHVTGEVLIHEMAWHDGELWFVNTRFSCLCTRDPWHSFVPRWRPPFVSGVAPEDRCHLNGLGFTPDGRCLVTALGQTDSRAGWRADKCRGGILMDAGRGEVLVHGLAMPHSPRAHNGRLWLLESGAGTLGYIDERAGRYEPIAQLPGFTRGLSFHGDYAFVGLSQVRESAVFSGLPITEQAAERCSGVWVIDLRSGRTVAFVKFEDALQEIFAVQVVPQFRFPELLNDDMAVLSDSFVLPDAVLAEVPDSLRFRSPCRSCA